MVILLGGSEQDISMFLDTPRLRDEPRDEEGRDDGRLRGLHLRLHHRMLGDVDAATDAATDTATGVRASPKDDCGMPWADCTKSLQRCGEAIERKASTGVDQQGEERAGFEDDGEDNKDNERTTEQRFESRRVTRYAEPASMPRTDTPRQMRLIRLLRLCETIGELFKNEGRGMIRYGSLCVAPVYSILIPMVLCCIYISHIVLPVLFVSIFHVQPFCV